MMIIMVVVLVIAVVFVAFAAESHPVDAEAVDAQRSPGSLILLNVSPAASIGGNAVALASLVPDVH